MRNLSIDEISLPCIGLGGIKPQHIGIRRGDSRSYIKDGLVFHLDGIDKGQNEGKWTDLVGGLVFEPRSGAVFYEDSTKGAYIADGVVDIKAEDGTIECCYKVVSKLTFTKTNLLFCTNSPNTIAFFNSTGATRFSFHYRKIGNLPASEKNALAGNLLDVSDAPHTVSLQCARALADTKALDANKDAFFVTVNNPSANLRTSVGVNEVVLYSVRVYDRHLTEEEVFHNQKIDCKRFGIEPE